MVKQGTIKEIREIKSGVGKGNKRWTLWAVDFTDGFSVTTFDNVYEPGQKVNISVEKQINEKNWVKYENYRIVPAGPRKESTVAQNSKFDEVMGTLSEIAGQLVGLEAKIDAIQEDLIKRP